MNMKKLLLNVSLVIGLLLALSTFSVSANQSEGVSFRARLNGTFEVPLAVSTGASGNFEARVVDGSLSYKLSFTGLEGGNTLFAHIHIGSFRTAGGVVAFLCGGGGKPACPNVSGTVEGTIAPADLISPNATPTNPTGPQP